MRAPPSDIRGWYLLPPGYIRGSAPPRACHPTGPTGFPSKPLSVGTGSYLPYKLLVRQEQQYKFNMRIEINSGIWPNNWGTGTPSLKSTGAKRV